MNEAETLLRFARGYGVDILDWGEQLRGSGLLVSVGAGLMMSTMDSCPSLRFALELGGGRSYDKLDDFMICADRLCSVIAVHAWWSLSASQPLIDALKHVVTAPLIIRSMPNELGIESPGQSVGTFIEFVAAVDDATRVAQ